jgi:hypothetical protein
MTSERAARTLYTTVPFDFPADSDGLPSNRCLNWNICEELALHLASEYAQVQVEADRSVRPVDILLKSYRLMEALGWGEPPLLRWVVRRVAGLLHWPAPDIARKP